jgi:hypothetical protein
MDVALDHSSCIENLTDPDRPRRFLGLTHLPGCGPFLDMVVNNSLSYKMGRRTTNGIAPISGIPRSERSMHGMTGTQEHGAWRAMLQRCYNPNFPNFHLYGGRGIKVCDRWKTSFVNFFEDMGRSPGKGYSIDRFPNTNGDYEPGNVRWATRLEQQQNLRKNVNLTFNGRTMCARAWAREIGIDHREIIGRIKRGLSPEKVLSKQRFWRNGAGVAP